ncbi:MAG: asparaginase [Tissierellales bacterium]|jgi:L-asparaginase|nr:asparaginase [Tissierellales bacterium]
MKKKIAIVFTGGTISMKVDPSLNAAIPGMTSEEIMSKVTNIEKFADFEIIKFSNMPGPHMTLDSMFELSQKVKELTSRKDISGVIVTHGTDTLEETAYFLDLTLSTEKPIVVVGAMRNGSELGYDGPSNIAAAICTAISDDSSNRGVLVVLNNEVNAAREVTKTNTLALNTFKSPEFGPLGIVDNDEVIYYRSLQEHKVIDIDNVDTKVGLVKACVGMDSDLINYMIDTGYNGIVIEGMGRGNLPPNMISGIKKALSKDIPVVLVSRCHTGRVLDTYGYEGAGRTLTDAGVILGFNLPGQKARIKLIVALCHTKNMKEIKSIFEKGLY